MLCTFAMLLDSSVVSGDAVAAARAVSLKHAGDDEPGLGRIRRGKAFRYVDHAGKAVRHVDTLSRIRALAIPPAWTNVWISPDANGHIQATGRDARGRKQYRYHAKWRTVRDEAKYHRLVDFCAVLPKLRDTVEADLACSCLCKRKVLATVVSLMECAQLRVGNDEYAKQNGSFGATTLRDRHATFHGDTLELSYRAKGGIQRHVSVKDARLARIVRKCRDLPGQRLFQYLENGVVQHITSTDVNEYLHQVTGGPFTAKDYRTWAATLGAVLLLCVLEHPGTERGCKQCVVSVIEAVAERLGHTPSVCRKSYIHPRVIEDFHGNTLGAAVEKQVRRKLGRGVEITTSADTISVMTLRAIEPVVAKYLDGIRNHA